MYGLNSTFSIKQDMDTRCFSLGVQYNFSATRSKYNGTGAGNDEKSRLQNHNHAEQSQIQKSLLGSGGHL